MRGDLSRTSAADACRELAREASTGLLTIDGPDGPGTVSLISGRIVAASSPTPRARLGDRLVGASYLDERDLDDALRLQRSGEGHARLGVLLVERGLVSRDAVRLFIQEQMLDALFDILRWRFGAYEFIHGEATEVLEIPLSIAVDEILVEVARRQQEWEQVSQVIPDLESVPNFRDGAGSAAAALEPDEFAVLASVDGERSVRALASDLGYGEFEAARIVYGLSLLGIVEVRLPEDEVGAAFDDAFSGDGGGDGRSEDQPVGDDAVADEAAGDGAAGGEVVVEAELDVDYSALIAEFTGARAPSDVAAEDDGEVTPSDVEAPQRIEARADAEDPDPEGPEPFEARIDDARRGDDDGGPVDAEGTEEADTSDAADWPGSDAWTDEPPDQPQTADVADTRAAGDDDDPGPVAVPPDAGRELPGTEPPVGLPPPPGPAPASAPPPPPGDGSGASDDGDSASDEVVAAEDAAGDDEPLPPLSGEVEAEDDEPDAGSGGGDVSEFLRELSRLALDPDDAATRPRPSRVSPAADGDSSPPPKREHDKPKKRGLFGWGG